MPNAAIARALLRNNFDSLIIFPGERMADVGAQGGNLAGLLYLFYDDFDITLEDIDSLCTNAAQVGRVLRYYARMRPGPPVQRVRTTTVIGTTTSTGLPGGAYSKVFFMNTYHEVDSLRPMLTDLFRITAPGGTLYVTERVSTRKRIRRHDCGHGMPIERELLQAFREAGFLLLKINVTDRRREEGDAVRACCFHFRKP